MRLFVDNLTNVDFSYLCPERGLLGETWLAHIELEGNLNNQGMVCDFGIVKSHLRTWLDETLDHKLIVPSKHPSTTIQKLPNDRVSVDLEGVSTQSPCSAITVIPTERITPESIAQWCIEQLQGHFGSSVENIRLSFTPEEISGPYYHYSHGLKKHNGNCQRIAHGHRSKILIWKDSKLCENSMREWANRWSDIYIGTQEDCTEQTPSTTSFTYEAPQGLFQLSLPTKQCYLIKTDSTVELIAQHIAQTLAQEHPGHHFKVKAFEGISKGAIVEA